MAKLFRDDMVLDKNAWLSWLRPVNPYGIANHGYRRIKLWFGANSQEDFLDWFNPTRTHWVDSFWTNPSKFRCRQLEGKARTRHLRSLHDLLESGRSLSSRSTTVWRLIEKDSCSLLTDWYILKALKGDDIIVTGQDIGNMDPGSFITAVPIFEKLVMVARLHEGAIGSNERAAWSSRRARFFSLIYR